MKNVLYIGNALSNNGKTKTSVETLGTFLKEICHVKIASNKPNKVVRLLDMIISVIKYKSNTDFVLIDTYSTSNFYYALIISQLCRFLKLKYIPILRGGNLEKRLNQNPKLSRLIFKNAYKLVSPSYFLKSIFNNYNYTNVDYIPNTIELSKYPFNSKKVDTIKLLWVRSLASIYNPKQAILVLKLLLDKGYKAELAMVGPDVDGSLDKVRSLAKEHDLDVNFTGKLTKEEWIRLSANYNVFINTTNFDNTPVSVIEAMALGLPVVSTNVGGLPFLIANNEDGILVNPNNTEAMVQAIIKLHDDDDTLKNKLINNARTKVETFDWDAVKPKWEILLS